MAILLLSGALFAVFLDVGGRAPFLTIFACIAGAILAVKTIDEAIKNHAPWGAVSLRAIVPIICLSSLPVTIYLGLACQDIALSRAMQLRLAVLEKMQKEDIFKAYSDLCPDRCGISAYRIIPGNAGKSAGKGYLMVGQFYGRWAIVDIASGRIEISEGSD